MPANRSDSRLYKDIGSFMKVHKAQNNREVIAQRPRDSLLNSRALKLVLTGQKVAGGKHSSRKCSRTSSEVSIEASNATMSCLMASSSMSQPAYFQQSQSLMGVLPSEASLSTAFDTQSHSQTSVGSFVVESAVEDENAVFEPESWQVKKPAVCETSFGELAAQSQREAATLIDHLTNELTKEQTPQKRVRNSVERCCAFAFSKLAAFVNEILDRLATRSSIIDSLNASQCDAANAVDKRLEALQSSGLLADAKEVESNCSASCATRLVLTVHLNVLLRFALLFGRVVDSKAHEQLVKQFVDQVVRLLRTLTFRVPESGSITVKILDAVLERELGSRRFVDQLAAPSESNVKAGATGIAKWVTRAASSKSASEVALRELERCVTVFNEIYEELGVAPKRSTLERCGLVVAAASYAQVRELLKRFTAFEMDEESDASSASEAEDNGSRPATRRSAAHKTGPLAGNGNSNVRKSASANLFHGFGLLTDSPIVNEASGKKPKAAAKNSPRTRASTSRSDSMSHSQSAADFHPECDTVDGLITLDERSNMSLSSGNSNSCTVSMRAVKRSTSARNEALGFARASRQVTRVLMMQVPPAAPATKSRRSGSTLAGQPRSRNNSLSQSNISSSSNVRDSASKRNRGASRALFNFAPSDNQSDSSKQPTQSETAKARTPLKRNVTTPRKSPRSSMITPRKGTNVQAARRSLFGATPRRSLFSGTTTPRKRRRTDVHASVFDLDSQSSVNVPAATPTTPTPAQAQTQVQTRGGTHRGVPDTPRLLRNYFLG